MFTKLSVALVLSVFLLTPHTSLADNACEQGSGFTNVGILASLLGTGGNVWGLEKDVEYLKSVGLTMAVIGIPIAFYGLYKEHSTSSKCPNRSEQETSKELKREKDISGVKILANEKSMGLGYQFRF